MDVNAVANSYPTIDNGGFAYIVTVSKTAMI